MRKFAIPASIKREKRGILQEMRYKEKYGRGEKDIDAGDKDFALDKEKREKISRKKCKITRREGN